MLLLKIINYIAKDPRSDLICPMISRVGRGGVVVGLLACNLRVAGSSPTLATAKLP